MLTFTRSPRRDGSSWDSLCTIARKPSPLRAGRSRGIYQIGGKAVCRCHTLEALHAHARESRRDDGTTVRTG
jgi:hypothetical protein